MPTHAWVPYDWQLPVAYAVSLAALLGGVATCARLAWAARPRPPHPHQANREKA